VFLATTEIMNHSPNSIDRCKKLEDNSPVKNLEISLNMVRIRLRRVGAKNKPVYRVVIADARAPRDGTFIETIGYYNPVTAPEVVVIDEEKAIKWLRNGAQPSATVLTLLSKLGITDKVKPGPAKKKAKAEVKVKAKPKPKPMAKEELKPSPRKRSRAKSTTKETT